MKRRTAVGCALDLLYYHVYIIKIAEPSMHAGSGRMREVKVLGLLGTGVIGGGWAARALHLGIDVVAMDTKPEMEAWIRGAVENGRASCRERV